MTQGWFLVTYRGAMAQWLHLFTTSVEPGQVANANTACGVDPFAAVEEPGLIRFVPERDPAMEPKPRCSSCEALA